MSSTISDYNKSPSKLPMSSLLKASIPESLMPVLPMSRSSAKSFKKDENLLDTLTKMGYTSIFDITRLSRSRFIFRYDEQLRGNAGEIYDRAASFTNQVIHKYRKQKLRNNINKSQNVRSRNFTATNDSDTSTADLPCYADLFPESWLDFCRENSVESIDSPVSYLVDLFRFIQEIEADGSSDSITLAKRRPDIAQLPLNYDSTYQELPELDLVNVILMLSIQNFLQGGDVYQALESCHFPFSLPYSFSNDQVHLGLSVKGSTLSELVKTEESFEYLPWDISKEQRNNVLLSATKLSQSECNLLIEGAVFSQYQLTIDDLKTNGFESSSTTEILPNANLEQHGYIVGSQGLGGPTTLVLRSASKDILPQHFENIVVPCTNEDGSNTINITLKCESVLTYHRVKARMVPFEINDDNENKTAYHRQLRLTLDDNLSNLSDGPYFGKLDINAQALDEESSFSQLHFAFAIADENIDSSDLWPKADQYFYDNYGVHLEQYNDLKKVTTFSQSINGSAIEVEQLLAQGDYQPKVSPNVVFKNSIFNNESSDLVFPDSYHYGAKYINNAESSPLSIEIVRNGDNGWREIGGTSEARYERINRFLRFARWAELPHDKLDLLLSSIMQAEQGAEELGIITERTVRGYGLFCYLNDKYSVLPEAFSAMFDVINVYSISPEISFFDYIFNQPQLFDTPFIQDDEAFDYTDPLDPSVKQICSGLSISTTTFLLLAPLVSEALELDKNTLRRSASVLSSLYRLVKLPALFNLSPEEGLDLLKILSKVLSLKLNVNDKWNENEYKTFVKNFIIHPQIIDGEWDTLDVVLQLEQLSDFMKSSGFTTSDLMLLLKVSPSPLVATQGMVNFFNSMKKQLTSEVLLSEESFMRPDLPLLSSSWMSSLSDLITADGLVTPYPEVWGQTDAQYLQEELKVIVGSMGLGEETSADTVAVLEQIITQAKSTQDNLVATAVANEYGVSRELVNPLLSWCETSVMKLCSELLVTDPSIAISETLFTFAYDLLLRTTVVSQFNLSFDALFMRLSKPEWLNLDKSDGGEEVLTSDLTLAELWLWNDYKKLLVSSSYTEEEVQAYFASANLDETLEPLGCANLLADILAWEGEEVLNSTKMLADGRAKTLLQVNWLREVQKLSAKVGISALSIISASQLNSASTSKELKSIAENVVAASKDENELLAEQLAETLRDALVGYYLDQLVPNDPDMVEYRDRLRSVDELYDFLLLDTQVSYKVKTAGVANVTKSLQQYINRITLNLEPGLSTTLEETVNWRNFANRYGSWAANQQLKIYPEVYIDPTLRLGKTDLFFQLESVLNQGKLNDDTVKGAVLGYLNNFEEVSNLEVLSGYETGVEIDKDKIFFVAKTRTQPYVYYWRSLDMSEGDAHSLDLYPSAWEEWKKIDLPLDAAEPRTVRPVILNDRLYIAWIETSEEEKEDNTAAEFITKMQLAHLKFDGSWSTPNLLKQAKLADKITDLIAVMDTTRAEDKLMLVSYAMKTGYDESNNNQFYDYATYFSYACDTMLVESTDFPPSGKEGVSDIDYYSDKLAWFYTRDHGNLYPDGGHSATTPDEAYARREVARELILYPYVNVSDFIISDPTLINGSVDGLSGKLGANNLTQTVSYVDDNINTLYITVKCDDYHYFKEPTTGSENLDTILLCIWVWEKGSPIEGDTNSENRLNNGKLRYVEYEAYSDSTSETGVLPGTKAYPENGSLTLTTTLELEPGWGEVVIQSGFSLVQENENWDSNTTPYFDDPGGRYTSTYYVGKKMRPLLQNKRNKKVEYLQFPKEYQGGKTQGTIRLNTLFAKELIVRANKGISDVLDWETQNLIEPPVTTNSESVPIDFNGANGIYFWELFFHMPYLVAWRLNIEQRYEEAAEWINYIFNPNETLDLLDLQEGKPRYWNCRPLSPLEDESLGRALMQPSDPDAIAESDPVHYRKSIFRFYVNNLIDEGDKAYRQQSPTSKIVARLSYDTAGALLDQRPDTQLISNWETCSLLDAANNNDSERRMLERETTSLKLLPVTHDASVSNQDNGLFLDPFNSKLTELWDTLERRLYNLRHNLTIDGKEMSTQLYDTVMDPMALQSKRYQRVVALNNAGASKFVVPNYRFASMLNKAMNGVETLIQFGSTLLSLLERKDGLNFDSFQMNQHLSMYSFTINLQQQAIEISEAELEASEAGREVAEQRYQHYKKLYDEDISRTEQDVIQLQSSAASNIITAQALRTSAAVLDMMPNMFGLAVGGMQWGAPLNALAEGAMISYHSDSTKADSLSVSESYRRRRQEWQIQYQQAELEMNTIDKQILVQQRQVKAAQTQLEQIKTEYDQAQTLFEYFSRRFTNENLYTWMTSQLSSLYLKAYDSVMSICLTTEAAWQYEIGQFDSNFVQPGVWNDLYQGLLVGESMKLGLVQMDQAFTYQNSRRQEITKTISLKEHCEKNGPESFDSLKNTGSIEFSFTDSHFNDFPDLTNLRIKSVAVSLPALIGPYQDICATLTQKSSTIDGSIGTESKQVVLSHGVEDSGLFTLNYDDERFLPFEGTGVVSEWSLIFSNTNQAQQDIYESLNDVIFHVNYTARTR
ncbi:Tc toxin subunit A-related protein [Aliivibrio fischeri]|uniref:Tc toxin subunit A-related protein n=1 Tax=Aliivibrio fischeri TaxID=668 RepID=UPI0016662ACB|nr:Tc toxin subunit A [Aliivibrio fischeri]USR98001.1 Tc toxin subunit A [Aliivibrio fischeri ATCC 7744 = JCM 18803 = DSM 507]GGK43688.1 hypothetical protein GCM10007987_28770 [Aliivibrio fischeri]